LDIAGVGTIIRRRPNRARLQRLVRPHRSNDLRLKLGDSPASLPASAGIVGRWAGVSRMRGSAERNAGKQPVLAYCVG
jgi:hypothetical protein